jgi:hypothetical protein
VNCADKVHCRAMLSKVEQCAGDLRGLLGARRAHEVIVHKMMKCRPGRLDMNPDPEVLGYSIDIRDHWMSTTYPTILTRPSNKKSARPLRIPSS